MKQMKLYDLSRAAAAAAVVLVRWLVVTAARHSPLRCATTRRKCVQSTVMPPPRRPSNDERERHGRTTRTIPRLPEHQQSITMHGGTLSHPPRVLASSEVKKIGVRAFRSMRTRRFRSTSRCSSGVRSTARATYRQEASDVLKAAPNTPKAPHCELVKVRFRAGTARSGKIIHLGTQSDASPGGGG